VAIYHKLIHIDIWFAMMYTIRVPDMKMIDCPRCRNRVLCECIFPPGCIGYKHPRWRHSFDLFLGGHHWYRALVGGPWVSYWVDCCAGPIYEPAAAFTPSSWGIEHAIHYEYHRGSRPPYNRWDGPDV
jgi:hypothetical protein